MKIKDIIKLIKNDEECLPLISTDKGEYYITDKKNKILYGADYEIEGMHPYYDYFNCHCQFLFLYLKDKSIGIDEKYRFPHMIM